MSPRALRDRAVSACRPRVAGDREQEILDATIAILVDVGYDRLTMDAVAARAKASKATLYRRWNGKPALVIEALGSLKAPMPVEPPSTGSLRGDLLATFCGKGGLTDGHQATIIASVASAMERDEEFAAAFRRDFIGPKLAATRTIFEAAKERGELRDDADLDLLAGSVPAIVMHRTFILGEPPTPDLIIRIVDQVILPAATRG